MNSKVVKIINKILTILFIVSIFLIFIGYFIPQSFCVNIGLVGFISLMFTATFFLCFGVYYSTRDFIEKIRNKKNNNGNNL